MYMYVVCFLAMQAPHRLCFIAKPTELADWIIDAVWLVYKDPSCYRVAFVTTHNAVLIYSVTGGSLSTATYQSEVNCILYPRVYHYYLPVSKFQQLYMYTIYDAYIPYCKHPLIRDQVTTLILIIANISSYILFFILTGF